MKVNDAERERIESEQFHQQTTVNFKRREEEVQKLQKDLKRNITKSKPYFEMKAKFNQVMEEHKRAVSRLEEDVASTKALYSQALRSLEAISDDIHRQRLERRRKLELGVRGAGVGAESPSPPPSWEKGSNIEGSASSSVFDRDTDDLHKDPRHSDILNNRPTGIVCHEPAFRKKTSITEALLKDGSLKPDPLDVVVFKTTSGTKELSPSAQHTTKPAEEPLSVSSSGAARSRSASYRAAIEMSSHSPQDNSSWVRTNSIVEGTEEEATLTPTSDILILPGEDRNQDVSRQMSPLSCSVGSRDLEHSSVRRAQEWVNKSPIPQQRRFVKSKSLIDASSSSLSISQSPKSELSSSLTSDIMKQHPWPQSLQPSQHEPPRVSISTSYNPTLNSSHFEPIYRTQVFSSQQNTDADQNPQTVSPSLHRKSPKLQGLILGVDSIGLNSTSVQQNIPSIAKPIISTQQLAFPAEKTTPLQSTVQIPTSLPTAKPPTSLITQHLSKMMNSAKVGNYNSKTAPSTLSASYTLPTTSHPPTPSPTWNPPSPNPVSTTTAIRHQLASPTPSSPSADRVSLSGRSDSLSASSNRGAFLKPPPSDGSDTESIASTGPMLDDDQVELINMDFSEQSIMNEAGDETQCFGEDRASITRGHWSRMSLPPRLSYLEGFLERTRLYNEHVGGEVRSESQQYEDGDNLQSSSSSSCEDKSREEDAMSRSGQSSNPDHNSKDSSLTQASETTAVNQAKVKAVPPQAEVKAVPPQVEVKDVPPQAEVKAVPPQAEVKAVPPQASIIVEGVSTGSNDNNSSANTTVDLTVVLHADNVQGSSSPSTPGNEHKLSSPDNNQVNDNHVFILKIDNEEMFIKNEDDVTKDNFLNDNLTTGPDDMSLVTEVDNTDDRSSVTDIDNVTDNDWDKNEYFV
ncbi:uncharacterized protein LOC131929494 isoform X2 [Physella acuta]|nr:uncharacterized protein LOC131929494 isoform X2 [Physella acuta]